ncbi:MAG: hypothetical protein LBQ73_06770 [Tannerellaceae bacterium]|jgi:hypothetical protein|nr:hypothetical protein [Tannerellaceae bacterium]
MIKGYKGFDKNLKCRDFQYEIGKEYEHKGKVKACENGFHFCEYPLDVFGYYPPSGSRFCEVEGDGDTDRDGGDSKVAVSKIKIAGEISIKAMVEAAVKFTFERAKWGSKDKATGDQGAASATGYRGAASATGDQSIACGHGVESKAKASIGNWIVLSEWQYNDARNEYERTNVKAIRVDGETIKADTYYMLIDGEFVEVE